MATARANLAIDAVHVVVAVEKRTSVAIAKAMMGQVPDREWWSGHNESVLIAKVIEDEVLHRASYLKVLVVIVVLELEVVPVVVVDLVLVEGVVVAKRIRYFTM